MPITTTAALLTAAGAGAGAYGSYQQSKDAASKARNEKNFLLGQIAPAKELESLQLDAYKDIALPDLQLGSDIYQKYAEPTADIYNQLLREYAGLSSNVFNPATEALYSRVLSDLDQPTGLPPELSDALFQRARERTAASFAPVRQRQSERLAASGSLDSGISNRIFSQLDLEEQKSVEDLAFQQALAEFDIARTGRQQAVTNVLGLLDRQRATPNVSVSAPSVDTGAVGALDPYLISNFDKLQTSIPKTGVNYADILKGGQTGFDINSILFA